MSRSLARAVVLVGHGSAPRDMPRALVQRLKALEAQRRAARARATDEEIELEHRIRSWPRSIATDPYMAGIEAIAGKLRAKMSGVTVVVAYNELCAPSIEDAVAALVAAGHGKVTLVTTMPTPGGAHSEIDIPEAVAALSARYPEARIRFAWPFDLDAFAEMLAAQVARWD